MKYFIITLTILTIFSGCSKNSAFDDFNLTKQQELSINSLQSSKIKNKDGDVDGFFSAIYLNEVYPDLFNHHEYFFIYRYNKSKIGLKLTLNSKSPIKIKKLSAKNKFSHLIGIETEWNDYYLISFESQDNKKLSLMFKNEQFFSDPLHYIKER